MHLRRPAQLGEQQLLRRRRSAGPPRPTTRRPRRAAGSGPRSSAARTAAPSGCRRRSGPRDRVPGPTGRAACAPRRAGTRPAPGPAARCRSRPTRPARPPARRSARRRSASTPSSAVSAASHASASDGAARVRRSGTSRTGSAARPSRSRTAASVNPASAASTSSPGSCPATSPARRCSARPAGGIDSTSVARATSSSPWTTGRHRARSRGPDPSSVGSTRPRRRQLVGQPEHRRQVARRVAVAQVGRRVEQLAPGPRRRPARSTVPAPGPNGCAPRRPTGPGRGSPSGPFGCDGSSSVTVAARPGCTAASSRRRHGERVRPRAAHRPPGGARRALPVLRPQQHAPSGGPQGMHDEHRLRLEGAPDSSDGAGAGTPEPEVSMTVKLHDRHHLHLVLLAGLRDRPASGADLAIELSRRSGGRLELGARSIYAELHHLARNALVESDGPGRYRLTDAGARSLPSPGAQVGGLPGGRGSRAREAERPGDRDGHRAAPERKLRSASPARRAARNPR